MTKAKPKEALTQAAAPPEATPTIRILKIVTCPSLSGKSKLTYHVGANPQGDILFRVYANTAAGFFSREWVAITTIQDLFGKAADAKAITSYALHLVFKGKSINTPAFLFAALLNEGLVQPSSTKRRCYECMEGRKFLAQVEALMASGVDLTDKLQKSKAKAAQGKDVKTAAKANLAGTNAMDSKMKSLAAEMNILPSQRKPAKKPAAKPS